MGKKPVKGGGEIEHGLIGTDEMGTGGGGTLGGGGAKFTHPVDDRGGGGKGGGRSSEGKNEGIPQKKKFIQMFSNGFEKKKSDIAECTATGKGGWQ